MSDPHWPDDPTAVRLPTPVPEPGLDGRRPESEIGRLPGPGWYPNHAVGATQWWDGYRWVPTSPPPTGYASAPMNYTMTPRPMVIIASPKSVGLAFLLAFLFGPLGMLYSTVAGGLIMLVVSFLVFFMSIFTFFLPTILCWVVCIVWSCIAASNSNSNVRQY